MAFILKRVIDLSPHGWDGCSITLASISYKEIKEWQEKYKDIDSEDQTAQDEIFKLLESKFISGEGLNEKGEKTAVEASDIPELPVEIVMDLFSHLIGTNPSPN